MIVTLTIERTMGENKVVSTYKLDGSESKNTMMGRGGTPMETVSTAKFDGPKLTIVTKQDFSLRIRDAATGKELRKIDLKRANSYSQNEWLAFTPDGKAIAVTSQGGVIHLIDVESGKTIRDFSNANPESSLGSGWESVLGIAFSRDGKLMASGGFTKPRIPPPAAASTCSRCSPP